jgi:hypothetical protein
MRLRKEDFTTDAYALLCECLESSDSIEGFLLEEVCASLWDAYKKGYEEAQHEAVYTTR